jgi:PAS domain S-box-containing protein
VFEVPRLVRTSYAVRTAALAYAFLTIGLHLWERDASLAVWICCALQFLAYPHALYWRATRAAQPMRAELDNLYIDSALLGGWIAFLGFPSWIALGLLGATMLNATVNRGLAGMLVALACSAAGAAIAVAAAGLRYLPDTSEPVTTLCFFGILGYTCAVGHAVHAQNRRIVRTREKLRASEERYRLITENAADLVAMVDPDGRWLYASPSYERLLELADLQQGGDAFARLHPEDAERARVAVLRVAGTGKPRELALRLVDRESRMRHYKTRVQALAGDGPPRTRILLVSQDVSDLRESEERLLLAGHALEGMTEAIVITGADGVVQTVNQAFCDITGYRRDEVVGRPEKALRNAAQPAEFYDEVYATVQREGRWSGSQRGARKDGSVYPEWRSVLAVRDADGATTHYVSVFFDTEAPKRRREGARSPGIAS